jgi:hypothetical protein
VGYVIDMAQISVVKRMEDRDLERRKLSAPSPFILLLNFLVTAMLSHTKSSLPIPCRPDAHSHLVSLYTPNIRRESAHGGLCLVPK